MENSKIELSQKITYLCESYNWDKIIFAGIVGSSNIGRKNCDTDLIIITEVNPNYPCLIKENNISHLVLNKNWLKYEIHLKNPTGLVPSILFKSLDKSISIIGNKSDIKKNFIKACKADFINIKIKKERYKNIDYKNYLVSIIFEELLRKSPDLKLYSFDNIKMAEKLGLEDICKELKRIYG